MILRPSYIIYTSPPLFAYDDQTVPHVFLSKHLLDLALQELKWGQ